LLKVFGWFWWPDAVNVSKRLPQNSGPTLWRSIFDQVRDRFGGLDLLFNNAGLGVNAPFEKSDPGDWTRMIDVNLYGVLHCTHAAIPLLRGRPGAMICSVSSVGGRYGVPNWSVYSATKFAVVGFHDALRKELGEEGIRVSVIEPGAVRTEFGANVADAMAERWAQLDAMAGRMWRRRLSMPLRSRRVYS
jgi:NAD(P)-dependent dehydrogenase (short-subunit alcohol dehydrogenase family)